MINILKFIEIRRFCEIFSENKIVDNLWITLNLLNMFKKNFLSAKCLISKYDEVKPHNPLKLQSVINCS